MGYVEKSGSKTGKFLAARAAILSLCASVEGGKVGVTRCCCISICFMALLAEASEFGSGAREQSSSGVYGILLAAQALQAPLWEEVVEQQAEQKESGPCVFCSISLRLASSCLAKGACIPTEEM